MKPIRKRACCLVPVLIGAILLAAFLAWAIYGGLIYETYTEKKEELHQPIVPFSLDVASMDQFLQTAYPNDCADMLLTRAILDVGVRDKKIVSGDLRMEYYRYINDFREGGNVAVTTFTIDPIAESVVGVFREKGSGKAIAGYSEPISESTKSFPLTLYVENLESLMQIRSDSPIRLRIESTKWGLEIMGFDQVTYKGYDYCERVENWTPGTPFDEREYELKEHAWGKAESTASPRPD